MPLFFDNDSNVYSFLGGYVEIDKHDIFMIIAMLSMAPLFGGDTLLFDMKSGLWIGCVPLVRLCINRRCV